jgi:hypothetical protein
VRKPLASGLVGLAVVAALVSFGSATGLARPTASPTVRIVSPSKCPCGIVTPQTSTVTIVVEVKNFTLSAAHFGEKPVSGQGHLLFSLDRGKFDHPKYAGANGRLAAKIGLEAKFSPAVKNKIVYRHIPEGSHTVVVYLAANDHRKLGPKAKLTFTVQ